MYLDLNKDIEYYRSAYKRFSSGEYHVTRVSKTDILILMLEGKLYFCEEGKETELSAGEYYIQKSGTYQSALRPSDGAYYIYLDFDGDFCNDEISGLPVKGKYDVEKLYPLADRLCRASVGNDMLYVAQTRVFYEILESLYERNNRLDEGLMVAKQIQEYIAEHRSDCIDVNRVAKRFSYSPDYVIRVFKRAYGITPHNYMVSCRIEYAKLLLCNTDKSVGEIASACGYRDFTTFFRAFKNTVGASPTEWRKKQRKNED